MTTRKKKTTKPTMEDNKKAALAMTANALRAKHLLEAVNQAVWKFGTLYARVVVPNWGATGFKAQKHEPWIVCHAFEEALDDEQIQSYVNECFDDASARRAPGAMNKFLAFLETKKYVVLATRHRGFCVVDINPDFYYDPRD